MLQGLHKYKIVSRHFGITHVHTAKNRKQAWAKFSTMHFGYMKPDKKDWQVTLLN